METPRSLQDRLIDLWTNHPRATLSAFFGVALLLGLVFTGLLVSIIERKQESRRPFPDVTEITDETYDPATWGRNFPVHYEDYLKTVDSQRTRFGGSEAVPRTPTGADPRSIVAQSKLEEDPRLKTMWAGYAFSIDFREERGHAYMLEDQTFTQRVHVVKQPGTCLNCHASTYGTYKKLGGGDIFKGFQAMNKMPYHEARKEVSHSVACIDCHTPVTMDLRVTRPAFMEGMRAFKASQGVKDYDVNRDATRSEMRSYVCGQCHVEYYFKGPEKQLTYPWANGLRGDQILDHYETIGFTDWNHKTSGAAVLKAQHPEFEMWSQGVHARSGVACADCHMPFKRVGAAKISDHHVRSPLLNVDASCRTCHPMPAQELLDRAHLIQTNNYEMRTHALDALVELIGDIAAADGKVSAEKIARARLEQKRAQFLADFVEAENSMGFHAPQESMRVLGLSIDHSRRGQRELWKP
jgi:nitrite reductase (cytochrome c-552)